jgi:hypothetical protein
MVSASLKQALARPVEMTTSNNAFSLTWTGGGGGGPTAGTVPVGMYSSIYDVIAALETALQAIYAGASVELVAGHKVRIFDAGGQPLDITWTGEALGRLLGFRDDIDTSASTYTATDTPQHCWVPTYYTFDEQRFHVKQSDVFKGGRSVAGQLSGVRLTTEQYTRVLKWDAEPAKNVFVEAAEDVVTWAVGGTFYPEAERSLEQFMIDARTATLSATTSGNLNPKGFYYVHDWTGYLAGSHPTSLDSGGIRFDLDTNPDTYVYCTPSPNGPPLPDMLPKTAKKYYSVQVEVMTGTAPVWNKP